MPIVIKAGHNPTLERIKIHIGIAQGDIVTGIDILETLKAQALLMNNSICIIKPLITVLCTSTENFRLCTYAQASYKILKREGCVAAFRIRCIGSIKKMIAVSVDYSQTIDYPRQQTVGMVVVGYPDFPCVPIIVNCHQIISAIIPMNIGWNNDRMFGYCRREVTLHVLIGNEISCQCRTILNNNI